ncbi:MAG: patatin-like phospholipase family protein, partial [Wenzhouxiangellaceae bacterium]|nr:patatin-like phospholipase family protein [Wenzhouxiangellaceae bacterium]
MDEKGKESDEGKTVSLVLGSGGARGLAHIGAIQALIENGFEIR